MKFLQRFLPVELTLKIQKILYQQKFLATIHQLYQILEFPHKFVPFFHHGSRFHSHFPPEFENFKTRDHEWFFQRNQILHHLDRSWVDSYDLAKDEYQFPPIRIEDY